MSNQCLKDGCNSTAQITCSKCNIVRYCTSDCMIEDLPGHSIICRESYPDMLRAYHQHLSGRNCGYLTISYPIGAYVKYNNIENYYNVGFDSYFFCICCGKRGVVYSSEKIRLTNRVFYTRCIECHMTDIRICVNSFVDDKLCWRGLNGLMLLREYILSSNIPYEIFGYIVSVIAAGVDSNGNKIACIEHMFKR